MKSILNKEILSGYLYKFTWITILEFWIENDPSIKKEEKILYYITCERRVIEKELSN